MPVMDGLTATREIRKGSSPPDLPILAMTANARVADREECLAAGMNDHIAKPIKPAILYEMLVRRLRPDIDVNVCFNKDKTSEQASLETAGDLPRIEGIDVQTGLGSVNNDWKLYMALLTNFHSRYQDIKEKIQTELTFGNHSVAQRLAHTIKGVAGTVGARTVSEISSQLESAIKNDRSDRIPDLLDRFAKEVVQVMTVLDGFIKNENAGRTEETTTGGEPETRSMEALDAIRFKKLFQELSDLINERDSDVIKFIAKIKTQLGPSNIGDHFLKLESQINSFKFKQAKETLAQAIKELDL